MRNISDKFIGKIKIHVMFNTFFFNSAFYEIMWKKIVEPGRPQMKTWRMCISRWVPKAANTHSEYVMLIAFLLQRWLHELSSMLRYTYIACLILFLFLKCRIQRFKPRRLLRDSRL